ncbi:MAG: ribonuclease D, partial [Deltaproteobacteria bacterium]|nr:ribonuclease D [Deltaproteobacteria bacterium]
MYELIEDISALNRAIPEIRQNSTIGVDLEADSMFHYREKVCLLQISSRRHIFIIDPLLVKDLSSLLPIFKDHKIRKIFHGADYDIRSLFRDFGMTVNGLFDTQIAARYLGIRAFGLANLLKDIMGIS